MRWLQRLVGRGKGEAPASPAVEVKTPVKVTVTARKVNRDGTLGEEITVENVRVERVEGAPHG